MFELVFNAGITPNALRVGDRVIMKVQGVDYSFIFDVVESSTANPLTYRINGNFPLQVALNAPIEEMFIQRARLHAIPQYKSGAWEICTLPPLSLFSVPHALPSMTVLIRLTPKNGDLYALSALNTEPATRYRNPATPVNAIAYGSPAVPNSYRVVVDQLHFYCQQMQSDRLDDGTFFIDLAPISISSTQLDPGTGLQTKLFPCSPSTYELGFALQDSRAGQSTAYPCEYFGYWRQVINGTSITYCTEQDVNRFYVQYGNKTYPVPDADPTVLVPSNRSDQVRRTWTQQRWLETTMASGMNLSSGGAESIDRWIAKGKYYSIPTYKDPKDRSVNVNVNVQVTNAADNVLILLYNKSRQVVSCRVANGLVTEVNVQDQ
jgi:hypothetical protein